jgi:hypothetical protein
MKEDCCGEGCEIDTCSPPNAQASSGCDQGNVHWFDSCGQVGELIEDCCGQGCDAGSCNPPDAQASAICDQGNVYWVDSCGVTGELKEDCCGEGCEGSICLPPNAQASYACDQGDVYWFDSCGNIGQLKEDCQGLGCNVNSCGSAVSQIFWIWDYDTAGGATNLIRSVDGGTTFESISVCTLIEQVEASADGQYVYVLCDNGLYRSTIYGDPGSFNLVFSDMNTYANMRISNSGQYGLLSTGAGGYEVGSAYVTNDYGQTWNLVALTSGKASWGWASRSGQYMTVPDYDLNSGIKFYYSTDYGVSWQEMIAAPGNYDTGNVVCSEDGQYWMIDTNRRGIYTSTDSLTTVTQSYNSTTSAYLSFGYMSENGRVAVANEYDQSIIFTDYFADATATGFSENLPARRSEPISADGRVVGIRDNLSIDYGETFTNIGCYVLDVTADGQHVICHMMIEAIYSGGFMLSSDGGQTFDLIHGEPDFLGQFCGAIIVGG